MDYLAGIPSILGVIVAVLALLWGKGRLDRRKGAQDVRDALSEAYNDATREVHNVTLGIPDNDDDILDELRERSKRGAGGGST